jgi:thiol-disulfide isomerase/thioredoxin
MSIKTLQLFLLTWFLVGAATAKPDSSKTLIIQGKLSNCPEKILKIAFEDANGLTVVDTIKLNANGEFYYTTERLAKPQRCNIQQNSTQINKIYVAPGYNLHITGDATDYFHLYTTKQITGRGAEVNAFRIKMDSTIAAKNELTRWYELKLDALLLYLKNKKKLDDSLMQVVFKKRNKEDKYFETFKNMIDIDNQSIDYYMLLQHLEMNTYTRGQMTGVVKENTPPRFEKGVSNDDYLISEDYKSWLLPLYLAYNKKLDILRDSKLIKDAGYTHGAINRLYSNKVKDQQLNRQVESSIHQASSIEQLNSAKKQAAPYLKDLVNVEFKRRLNDMFQSKEQELTLLQIGKPAPVFKLISNQGQTYALEDFKGKILYIDLWASWCGPCREEMPNYKKLVERYKNNPQVAFIGIAVSDGEKEWRKALAEEKPTWLQLYDRDGVVARTYVANAIPKYILIDAAGKVLNFNTPGPGSPEILKALDAALAKP